MNQKKYGFWHLKIFKSSEEYSSEDFADLIEADFEEQLKEVSYGNMVVEEIEN